MKRSGAARSWWWRRVPLLVGLLAGAACSGPSGPSELPADATVPLAGGSVLVFQDGGLLVSQRGVIEEGVRQTLAAVTSLVRVDGVRIEVRASREGAIPEIGFGGRAFEDRVRLSFDPGSPVLESSLETELFPLLAHELHHVARLRATGYPGNLLGAMVLEGLADQFSIEVAGVEPPLWSSALSGDEIEVWLGRAREVWLQDRYDHDAWFFGTGSIPRWAGYTLGFELTGRYLAANPGRRASELYAEPALSFVP